KSDEALGAWLLSDVEVCSAIERQRRSDELTDAQYDRALSDFDAVWRGARLVQTIDAVKLRARRVLALHALGAADALQLGAALVAADEDPRRLDLVCLDLRLCAAARREGFRVIP